MTEFVALRDKLYAYKTLEKKEEKNCKEIKKSVIKKPANFRRLQEVSRRWQERIQESGALPD